MNFIPLNGKNAALDERDALNSVWTTPLLSRKEQQVDVPYHIDDARRKVC